ncbi:uncharacterized protein CcaverHIS019_0603490 [Cutaneotrichosporon cavernicola]|uniref:Endonuclease/exonuclease/phosphatase domain-containing protein n=1 Tax=Cutaneotrichosporon cavernicola TaxID=279322 RepID=A0AA48L8J8_9TREE|nr:uncharacterized protein CcaverHIS019_0603490 [Cutaneotrichosporon cavernicola]BEI93890.1 hypothetical protein CcaverHIS019_0603490 [Cutaneotrichosporon cavernicola]BEJ01668.1 hypothetical protein CcaverHIS631_0603500 [Cutaneotrichosporon cavernicola]BEJ09436.1 hypothetical protein CcaverHIS641_0603510 [Cutaneotrichosporon cavernicola]
MPPPPHLTPAQIAKQAERKAAKLARKAAMDNPRQLTPDEAASRRIIDRRWMTVGPKPQHGTHTARVVTWNMLAQTLVRRDLFPGSDCLRWSDRKAMLQAEMERYAETDVICLQECDRLPDMRAAVPGHEAIEARGPGKLHGLVVLYRTARWRVRASRAVQLDLEHLNPGEGAEARGGSRATKNMCLIVALEDTSTPGKGIVVATTHLFWHPKFEYERTRQIIVLLRAIRKLQTKEGIEGWPAMLAGDLNSQPAETAYQILAAPSVPLHPEIVESLNLSRLVHTNVAKIGVEPGSEPPSESASGTATPAVKEKDDEDELPDTDERSIAGTRRPIPGDGIATLDELLAMAAEVLPTPARSAYGVTEWGSETYAARGGFKNSTGAGGNEPAYTCFTPLFKLTLDYLFVLPRKGVEFTQVLEPPKVADLGEGLPRKGISASDHLPVACEISWTP